MKQSKRSRIISTALILCSIAMVIVIAFSNSELTNAWQALKSLHQGWLMMCVACLAGYIAAEGMGLSAFLKARGYRLPLPSAIHLSFQGLYYANITPGSSGGQPMQVYLMKRRNIPVGVGSSALTVRFFFNQLAAVVMTIALWLGEMAFCRVQLGRVSALIVAGWLVNFSSVPLILLAVFKRSLMDHIARWLIGLGARLRLVKQPEEALTRVEGILDNFHDSIREVMKRPGQLVAQMALSLTEMLCLTAVTIGVYHAFGQTGASWSQLLAVAFMLFVSASYTPLPGASGAQEGGFLLYYRGIFTGGTLSVALLVWRFMTYYLILIIGAGDALLTGFRRKYTTVELEADAHAPENGAA